MTTIAWDGKTLAADKQMTFEETRFKIQKILPIVENEMYLAFSGDLTEAQKVLNVLVMKHRMGLTDEDLEVPEIDFDKVSCIIARLRPRLYICSIGEDFEECEITDKFACGSGMQAAMVAMNFGKSAFDAVLAAEQVDIFTGLGVDVLTKNGLNHYDDEGFL